MDVPNSSPEPPAPDESCTRLPSWLGSPRGWNIAWRTVHLATMGILLGGHVYAPRPAEQLPPILYATLLSGGVLMLLEIGLATLWFHQGRGLLTMLKLALLPLVPLLWNYRIVVLLIVVALGAIGSHMPAAWRYYSFWYRRVVKVPHGPGGGRI